MSFNQRLEIEFVVNGGCIGAFQKSKRELALDIIKNYTKTEKVPACLLLQMYEDSQDVTVLVYNMGEQVNDLMYSTYSDAWIGAQQEIRKYKKFNEDTISA